MLTVVFISLLVLMLMVLVVATTILVRFTFWDERKMAEQDAEMSVWRPPFVHGDALRNWATATTARFVGQRLQDRRDGRTFIPLAREVEDAATQAMLPLARQAELERVVICPQNGQGLVGLTAPEAFAVAAQLRRSHSASDVKRIHDLARENTKQIRLGTVEEGHRPLLPCPLQGADQVCCVYTARPVSCRPLHAAFIASGMGERRATKAGGQVGGSPDDDYAQTIARGFADGLTQALDQAGVDGRIYELNSVLAKVLATPDAAERWAKGENVFASCLTVPQATTSAAG